VAGHSSGSDMDAGEGKLIEAAVRFAVIAPTDVVEQFAAGICGRLAGGRGTGRAGRCPGNRQSQAPGFGWRFSGAVAD